VLAIYPGCTASYEKRELAFDQTYYDVCKALSALPLKNKNVVLSRLVLGLEDFLGGSVVQKGERFYVESKKGERSLEAHLLAEGHRKIAVLVHLINNGSIDKGTVLFWDEPEANLNPRLIRHIALFLRELANLGIQVFVTTHDYLLIGELSMATEYQTVQKVPVRFLAMSRKGDGPVHVQTGETLADLHDNPILDEFADHYQREQDASLKSVAVEGRAMRKGNLAFVFGRSWTVLKYDEPGGFYKTKMATNVAPTKAIDFLCIPQNQQPLLLMEAKDFSLGVPHREKFNNVQMAVAIKARDTVAGIIGGSHCASDAGERAMYRDSQRKLDAPPRVRSES